MFINYVANKFLKYLVMIVDKSRHVAAWVVVCCVVVTGLLLFYTVENLTLDTDPVNLLDQSLPFRQLENKLDVAFPELNDLIVIVIDQGTSEGARHAALQLVSKLKQQPSLFPFVYDPAQTEFFDIYGLLYFDTDELWNLDERLSKWEPFLGTLAHDPSLRGLFSMLTLAFDKEPNEDDQVLLKKIFRLIGEAIEAHLNEIQNPLPWEQTMLEGVTDKVDPERRFILTKPKLNYSMLESADDPIAIIRQQSKELEEQFGVRIRLTGSIPIEMEERVTLSQGASLAAVLSIILVFVILLIGLRTVRLVIAMLCTLAIGLIWTGAFAVFTIGTLNFISATAPVLFIGLGVDFGIQFGMRYRESFNRIGLHDVALREAILGIGGALTISAIAASLCFFSFLPTAYRGFAELGLIAGGGMFLALLANVTIFPALLTIFPIARAKTPISFMDSQDSQFLNTLLIIRYRRTIIFLIIPILVLACIVFPQFRFDYNPLHLRDSTMEGVSTFKELLEDSKTSPYAIDILAKDLTEAEEFIELLKRVDEVDRALTLTSFIPKDQEEKLAIINEIALVLGPVLADMESLPSPDDEEELQAIKKFHKTLIGYNGKNLQSDFLETSELLSKSLKKFLSKFENAPDALSALRSRLIGKFPDWLARLQDLITADVVTLETLPQALKDYYLSKNGLVRVEVYPVHNGNDNEKLSNFVSSVQEIIPQAIGSPVGIIEGGRAIVYSCMQATILAILASTMLLFIVLKRLDEVLLVLLPVLMTMILTVLACLLLNISINLANAVALPLVLGLGIAFGIYLMWRKHEGFTVVQVLQSSTPRAILFSALTTMASFGALGFSRHPGMASLGILLALTLVLALVCSLIVLPAIMAELEMRGWWKE